MSHALYIHFFLESPTTKLPAAVCTRFCIAELRRVDKYSVWRVLGAAATPSDGSGTQVYQPDIFFANYADFSDLAFNTLAKVGKGSRFSMAASARSLLLCFSPLTSQCAVDTSSVKSTTQPDIGLLPVKRNPGGEYQLPHVQSVVALTAAAEQTCALCGKTAKFSEKNGHEVKCGPLVGLIRGPMSPDGSIFGVPTADSCWLADGGFTNRLPLQSSEAKHSPAFQAPADQDVARNVIWVHALCMNIGMLQQPDIVVHGGGCNALTWLQGHCDKFISMHPQSRRPLALVLCGGLYCSKSYHLPDVLTMGWGKCQSHTQPGEADSNVHPVLQQLLAQTDEDLLSAPPCCFVRKPDGAVVLHGWVVAFNEPSGQHTVLIDGHPYGQSKLTALVSASHWTSSACGKPLQIAEAPAASDYRSRHLWDSADIGRNVLLYARPGDDSVRLYEGNPSNPTGVGMWAESPLLSFHSETKEDDTADDPMETSAGRRRGRSAVQSTTMTLAECLSAQHSFAGLKSRSVQQSLYPSVIDLGIPSAMADLAGDSTNKTSTGGSAATASMKSSSSRFFDALQIDPVLALSIPWLPPRPETPLGTIRLHALSPKLTRFVKRAATQASSAQAQAITLPLPVVRSPVPTTITLSASALSGTHSTPSSTGPHATPLPSTAVQLPSISALLSSACPTVAVTLSTGEPRAAAPGGLLPLPVSSASAQLPLPADAAAEAPARGTKRARDETPASLAELPVIIPPSSLQSSAIPTRAVVQPAEPAQPVHLEQPAHSAQPSLEEGPFEEPIPRESLLSSDASAFRAVAGVSVSTDMPMGLPLAVLYASPHTIVLRRAATHSLANGITQNNPLAPPANAFVRSSAVRHMPVAGASAAALNASLQNFAHFFGGMHGQSLMLSACMLQDGGCSQRMLPVSRAIELGMPAQRGSKSQAPEPKAIDTDGESTGGGFVVHHGGGSPVSSPAVAMQAPLSQAAASGAASPGDTDADSTASHSTKSDAASTSSLAEDTVSANVLTTG